MTETKNDERGASGAVKRRRTATVMLTVDEVRKCRELSKPPMTTPIDYSRPVGWWCAFCEEDGPCFREQTCISMGCKKIPVYLPIPEGQRPQAASEVEEAEVVTLNDRHLPDEAIWYASNETTMVDFGLAGIRNGLGVPINLHLWDASRWRAYLTTEINRIAQASARARIVTGATE